jgi:iron complex transport system substrate-binding protein
MNADRARPHSSIRGYLRSSAFICGSIAFCITTSTAASITLKDDLDRTVELKQPAQRIVTLAPSLTELVFSVGAGSRVVGVSAYSDYPPEAKKLPQVSTAAAFSIEAIAALKPDLVLAWRDSVRREDIERLTSLGAVVFVAHSRNFEDVPRLLVAIGALAGTDGAKPAAEYQAKLARVRRDYAGRPKLTAILEIWNRPLTTIAGRHFMNEALEICGATNVFQDLPGIAPVVPWEEVYRRDPQVVVGASSAASLEEFRANWRERPTLAAVQSDRLVFVDADRIQRLTARTPDGIADLCQAIARVR